MHKRIFLIIFSFLLLQQMVFAAEFKVGGKEVREGDFLTLFYDELEAGKIEFTITEEGLKKAEITFDKGRQWQVMEQENGSFSYKYRPPSDEKISPQFLLTFQDNSMRTLQPDFRINYQRYKPDNAVIKLLEKMKLYYEQENASRFISLFSHQFPDWVKFRESIQNDFYNYKNIRLRYRVDRRDFDEDYTGAVWDVYWERRYDSRTGTNFSDNSLISMRMDKEGDAWLISGFSNNLIFGSSLLSSPDLKISSQDIGLAGFDVTAVIHNKSNVPAGNFRVKFTSAESFTQTGYEDVTTLGPNSQISVTHTFAVEPDAPTVTVVVDSSNAISEINENNNQASRTFPP